MKRFILFFLWINALARICFCQEPDSSLLSYDFKNKAFEHVKNLSSFGIRCAGSTAENKTIKYIVRQYVAV